MVMKIRLPFFLFLLIATALMAQNQSEITDSLQNSNLPDSLAAPSFANSLETLEFPDTLFSEGSNDSLFQNEAFSDSLFRRPYDTEAGDTTYIDLVKLQQDMNAFVADKRKDRADLRLPFLWQKENFHYKAPFDPQLEMRQNGFTLLPFRVANLHTFQNLAPFVTTSADQGFIDFNSDNYTLPVTLTEAYLGLGDIDMNHAAVNYRKGNIFGIPSLNADFGYVGQDGKWLGKREKSANFDLHLFYVHKWGKLHFYHTSIDQEISSNALAEAPMLSSIDLLKERTSSSSVKLETNYLDLGFRTETSKVDSLKRKFQSLLVSKQLQSTNHELTASYEYFDVEDDDAFNLFTVQHRSKVAILAWSNRASYREADRYYLNSLLQCHVFRFLAIQANYEKYGDDYPVLNWQNERKAAGLKFISNAWKINMLAGKEEVNEVENNFAEVQSDLDLKVGRLTFFLRNWLLYRDEDQPLLPHYQTKNSLEIVLNLKYNNKIRLGTSHLYVSDYGYYQDFSENLLYNNYQSLDAWLAIQITDRFQIRVDGVNLLNANELFGYPTSEALDGTHFNFSVYWLLVN
ncbi:MAG TPA: hypothetical protein PLD62_02485 [Candidatus Cloacimonadota bacterium]|nr:hypothetical protein [Candidatus Cloacimonadota bacterium]